MADAMPDLTGRRILIVEDEYLVATTLVEVFEDYGAEIVGMAASLAQAQAIIEAVGDRLDGAVLDVNLGGERAYPVADALMAREIPFVFASGYDKLLLPERYAGVPCCGKPIRMAELARVLTEQMAR